MYTGRGNFEFGLQETFPPTDTSESSANTVLFPFGSPNTTGVGALCFVAYGMIAPQACFGQHYRHLSDDLDHADLILVWGANPATDSPPSNVKRIKRASNAVLGSSLSTTVSMKPRGQPAPSGSRSVLVPTVHWPLVLSI